MEYHVIMRPEQPILKQILSDSPSHKARWINPHPFLNKEIVHLGLSLSMTIRQKQDVQAGKPQFHGFQSCCTSVLSSTYAQKQVILIEPL